MSEPQQFLSYQSEDGYTHIDVMLEAETLWLSQKQLTELFGKAKGTISEHIKHIFEDGELTPAATVRLFRTVQSEGGRDVTREVEHYNLDMVLALGFRVRSPVGVRFRQWAKDKLKEYIVKGFVLDDARLKNPGKGQDYFDELIRRLQDIRTSERRFYQKITDIYATSVDYDASHALTQTFFATVQNKVHYAIHGQTAAELIATRADSGQPNMGLTTWEGVFDAVRSALKSQDLIPHAMMFSQLAAQIADRKHPPFDFAVMDESQDVSIAQLRFLAAMGKWRVDALFFAGDLGQRIFQQPFSWKSLGVDIRGRSRTLHINYRTSHQIRMQADRLLGPEVSDVDGNTEDRRSTVSVFNGTAPVIKTFGSQEDEINAAGEWLQDRSNEGIAAHEIGVFVRSDNELERARAAVEKSGLPFKMLDEHVETSSGYVSISTMHLAKGLEFRAVVVMACDDEIIPSQERIETVSDNADLEEVYNTERHLLYVACTRAKDHLLVSSVEPASEFLDDLSSVSLKDASNKDCVAAK